MDITRKQFLVLDYIKKFIATHGYSPTVREICAGLCLKSPSTVHDHIKKLVLKGVLTINPTKSRTIELLVENEYENTDRDIAKLPIITEEFLDVFSREFLTLPIFMLNGYDSKNLCAYKENKIIFIVNKALKENNSGLNLYLKNKKLSVATYMEAEFIGNVISKFESFS